jgi:hypothetical protein
MKKLDDADGPERPWSSRGSSTPKHRDRATPALWVDERFVVVEGPEAEVLRTEQTRALRAVLTWLADNPAPANDAQP